MLENNSKDKNGGRHTTFDLIIIFQTESFLFTSISIFSTISQILKTKFFIYGEKYLSKIAKLFKNA